MSPTVSLKYLRTLTGCQKASVLLIGDSTDRMLVEAVCKETGGTPEYFAPPGDEV